MAKINSGKIKMKPKWYFVAGSIFMFGSLIGLSIFSTFFFNLIIFLIRKSGSGQHRLQLMLTSFPWWVLILALVSLFFSIFLLRKYDFSYRKNFTYIVLIFILAVFLSAFFIDQFGLNDLWARGKMRRFYQNLESCTYRKSPDCPSHFRQK